MNKILCILFSLLISLPLFAAEEAGIDSAFHWLEIIDSGDYEESWDFTGALFQRQLSSAQWAQALSQSRQPLGDMVSREVGSSTATATLPGAPEGEYLVLVFNASFENKNAAVETVTFSKEEGEWLAIGYFIR